MVSDTRLSTDHGPFGYRQCVEMSRFALATASQDAH